MICIAMEEPLKDGEIGNIRENLKTSFTWDNYTSYLVC